MYTAFQDRKGRISTDQRIKKTAVCLGLINIQYNPSSPDKVEILEVKNWTHFNFREALTDKELSSAALIEQQRKVNAGNCVLKFIIVNKHLRSGLG